jgi:hypothetical protein
VRMAASGWWYRAASASFTVAVACASMTATASPSSNPPSAAYSSLSPPLDVISRCIPPASWLDLPRDSSGG